jgi:hypothetical protein
MPEINQLAVKSGHFTRHFGDRPGCSDTGNDIFALSIDQIFAVHLVFAGTRIAGKANASGAVVTHVAEYHADDIDGGAVGLIGCDVEFTAVVHCAFAHPRSEYGADGDLQLLVYVFGERFAGFPEDDPQETLAGFAQPGCIKGEVR